MFPCVAVGRILRPSYCGGETRARSGGNLLPGRVSPMGGRGTPNMTILHVGWVANIPRELIIRAGAGHWAPMWTLVGHACLPRGASRDLSASTWGFHLYAVHTQLQRGIHPGKTSLSTPFNFRNDVRGLNWLGRCVPVCLSHSPWGGGDAASPKHAFEGES